MICKLVKKVLKAFKKREPIPYDSNAGIPTGW